MDISLPIIPLLANLWELVLHQGFPCPFHLWTGYYCPGCGGTRAVFFLLTGHPLLSVRYHPLVLFSVCVLGYAAVRILYDRFAKSPGAAPFRLHPAVLWAALIILVANFAVKNAALFFFDIALIP